jgi:hypothetical protein
VKPLLQRLFLVTVLAGGRPLLFHGVTGPAEPVGDVLAEIRDMACPVIFPVALFAIAFHVTLVRPVGEYDAVLELEYRRAIFSKSCCRHEKDYRD